MLPIEQLSNHVSVLGRSGTGKTTFLLNQALALIEGDEKCAVVVIDPMGYFAETLINHIPPHRIKDTCYFDITDDEYSIGFNPFAYALSATPADRYRTALQVKQGIHDVFADAWGDRLDWLAYNCIRLALDSGLDLAAVPIIINKKTFRDRLVANITDPMLLKYWGLEFPAYSAKYLDEAKGPLLNKIGQFLASPYVFASMGQATPKLDLARFIDEPRILIVNLSKARLGEKTAYLFGAQIFAAISNLATARRHYDARGVRLQHLPVFVLLDEWQDIANEKMQATISQARNFSLFLTLANQNLSQIDMPLMDSILGNVGTFVTFAVQPKDADYMVRFFHPHGADQLIDMARFHARIRAFPLAQSHDVKMPAFAPSYSGSRAAVIAQSREKYGRKMVAATPRPQARALRQTKRKVR